MKKRIITIAMSIFMAVSALLVSGISTAAKEDLSIASGSDAFMPEPDEVDLENAESLLVELSPEIFEDENFRNYLKETFDPDNEGVINKYVVRTIDCSGRNISSLKGIEKLTYVEELYFYNNKVEKVDLSKNTSLKKISFANNRISEINLSKNIDLEGLACSENRISELDLSKNTKLKDLYCNKTSISELDLSNNTNLEELYCNVTGMKKIILPDSDSLRFISAEENSLTELDVTKTKNLESLYINKLKPEEGCTLSLDIRQCSKLKYLHCSGNRLSKLLVNKNNVALKSLDVDNTGLKDYRFLKYTKNLEDLYCAGNGIETLDVSVCPKLQSLNCSENKLTGIDISNNANLRYFYCRGNKLINLDVSKNTNLEHLDYSNTGLKNLDVSKNTNLDWLECRDNGIKVLDVSKNVMLKGLFCSGNKLLGLDVSRNKELRSLNYSNTGLKHVDISKNTELSDLYCADNGITDLDVSANKKLALLNCSNNELTKLDLSKNPLIRYVECDNNHLLGIDMTHRGSDCTVWAFYQKVFLEDISPYEGKLNINDYDEICYPIEILNYGYIHNTYLIANPGSKNIYISYDVPFDGGITVEIALQKVPQLKETTLKTNGVNISWNSICWASCYNVYRKVAGGTWEPIAKGVEALQYTDKTAISGKTYYYTVRALKENKTTFIGDYDRNGIRARYIAAPKLSKVEATSDGVKVSFGAVRGAVNYSIHRKEGSGSWKKIGTTTSTSYVDKTAVKGKTYSYTVRCVSKDGSSYVSAYNTKGLTLKYLAIPKPTSVTKISTGIKFTYGAVTGASRYAIFRKEGSGSWKKIGTTTNTSYTDKTAIRGKKYTYTVRCVSSDGKFYESYYNTKGSSITYK